MTETMPRTSAEISASRHKTLYPQATNKTKTVYYHIKLLPRHCKFEINTPTKQIFKQFDMHVEFNVFLHKKLPACKFFIPTIQTLNLSQPCTCLKLSPSMEVTQVRKKNYQFVFFKEQTKQMACIQ